MKTEWEIKHEIVTLQNEITIGTVPNGKLTEKEKIVTEGIINTLKWVLK